MKVASAVLMGCFVAILAGQAYAKPGLPQRAAKRARPLKYAVTEESLAKHAAKLQAAAAEYAEKGLPTVNAQEIRERAQQAVERAKSSPTSWSTWDKIVQAKMAGRKQVSSAMKGEKMHPQKANVHMQKFHNRPGGYPGQDLRQEIAAEARIIPKTVPHQQQTLAKQQSSYSKPKTMPYPGAASKRVMQQAVKSYSQSSGIEKYEEEKIKQLKHVGDMPYPGAAGKRVMQQAAKYYNPGMPNWDEEKMRQFMQLSDEKKVEITNMIKEKAQEAINQYSRPPIRPPRPPRG